MSQKFVVVFEADADFVIATQLADRVLLSKISWLEGDTQLLDSQRRWMATDPGGNSLTWKSIPGLARAKQLRLHGHFNGDPGLPDAHAARRALRYIELVFGEVDAVMLVRDLDNDPTRRKGLDQARQEYPTLQVVIAAANTKRECWVIAGYEPQDAVEEKKLNSVRGFLGFDPLTNSHELTATGDNDKRSAKRVHRELLADDHEREAICWTETALEILQQRGIKNGLKSFLDEVGDRLVPLISDESRLR